MKYSRYFFSFLFLCTLFLLLGCQKKVTLSEPTIVIGFSQSGSESSWRKRHTQSVLESLEKQDYEVMYRNGLMNQERQIQDIRTFIAFQVDVIVFTPLTENGWEPVLKEAKKAGIPVILIDREIKVTDSSLFLTHIGPSFKAEGNRAGIYVTNKFAETTDETVNVLELSGLPDTSPTILRHDGFLETIRKNPKIQLVQSISGDYTRSKGKETIRELLKKDRLAGIDILYSHSDEMTIGALEALDDAGIAPGKDLTIVSIDAQKNSITALKKGRINAVVECNPEVGPYLARTITRYLAGKTISKEIYMPETIFSDQGNLASIPPRNY